MPHPGIDRPNIRSSEPLNPTGTPSPSTTRQTPDGTTVSAAALAVHTAQRAGSRTGRTAARPTGRTPSSIAIPLAPLPVPFR
ncbi:hypothetical protein GCM10009738_38620 [Kitasatospora viridis]